MDRKRLIRDMIEAFHEDGESMSSALAVAEKAIRTDERGAAVQRLDGIELPELPEYRDDPLVQYRRGFIEGLRASAAAIRASGEREKV